MECELLNAESHNDFSSNVSLCSASSRRQEADQRNCDVDLPNTKVAWQVERNKRISVSSDIAAMSSGMLGMLHSCGWSKGYSEYFYMWWLENRICSQDMAAKLQSIIKTLKSIGLGACLFFKCLRKWEHLFGWACSSICFWTARRIRKSNWVQC